MLFVPETSLSSGRAKSISSCAFFVVVSILLVVLVVVVVGCCALLFFGIVTIGLAGFRLGNSSRTVPGRISSSSLRSVLLIGTVFCVDVVLVVVYLLLVLTDVEVFLDGGDVLGLVNVVAGTDCVDVFTVAVSSSTQLLTGPLHCPDDVHVMTLGPSSLYPRAH